MMKQYFIVPTTLMVCCSELLVKYFLEIFIFFQVSFRSLTLKSDASLFDDIQSLFMFFFHIFQIEQMKNVYWM